MILSQNISVTPQGPKCKHGLFCSIFHNLSEYFILEITLWGKQGLLVIQKTTIYWQQFNRFSPKICGFCPTMNPQNAKTVFESSVMDIYDIYYEKTCYNV
jgi:hypothetical protein